MSACSRASSSAWKTARRSSPSGRISARAPAPLTCGWASPFRWHGPRRACRSWFEAKTKTAETETRRGIVMTDKITRLGAAGLAAATLVAFSAAAMADPAPANYPKSIGAGEGALNIVAWEGYAQDDWVKPFEKDTGCIVNKK